MSEQRKDSAHQMRPIWFFVGELLIIIGLIVALTGLWELHSPPAHKPVLWELHTGIWWGLIIAFFGGVLFFANRKARV